ncbi:MAG: glycoside hydrolase family 26 protein [Chitinophagaceae bacterium]|jgi:hypothetical protein|nr:glycoside hydrolase family 26 protein [Chitinophagaceae bacterium]
MPRFKYILALLTGSFVAGSSGAQQGPTLPPDRTAATRALYGNLAKWYKQGKVLIGHQDDVAYGVNWQYQAGRSDVKEVTGAYPAVHGWELGNLELDSASNLDKVPFPFMRQQIIRAFESGAVITISWHANNPLTGKSAWDPKAGTVASVLPGGSSHQLFVSWLHKVADFLASLQTENGQKVPVLFRPWHEQTGNWFWWCQNVCTPDEFKQLWMMTVDVLQNKRGLKHLIWVYNTAEFNSITHLLERYPGNAVVDMISFDNYQYDGNGAGSGTARYLADNSRRLQWLRQAADSLGKLPALAETGYETIPQNEWWTKTLLPLLQQHPVCYVLLWRNAGKMPDTGKMHYYAPYAGHASAPDFVRFFQSPTTVFANQLSHATTYQ